MSVCCNCKVCRSRRESIRRTYAALKSDWQRRVTFAEIEAMYRKRKFERLAKEQPTP